MSDLNVISYNVRWLGHPIKRKKILSQLKMFKCSIVLLQETHLNEYENKKLEREWVDQFFFFFLPAALKAERGGWLFYSVDQCTFQYRRK